MMEEEKKETPVEPEKKKTDWRTTKEGWYDKIPFNLKQMNVIVGVCWTLLILTFVFILLDAWGVF